MPTSCCASQFDGGSARVFYPPISGVHNLSTTFRQTVFHSDACQAPPGEAAFASLRALPHEQNTLFVEHLSPSSSHLPQSNHKPTAIIEASADASCIDSIGMPWIRGRGKMDGSLRIFVHVPKCGGRTVQRHLERHLGAHFWSVDKRFRYFPLELFGRKFDHTVSTPLDDILAISGHFLGRSIENSFPDRRIVRSLILREPEKQMLSWYNFRMMRYMRAGQSPYSFRLFLRSMPSDPVAHFLLERWLELPWLRIAPLSPTDKRDLLDRALAEFDIIADIANTDQVIAQHSAALGIPREALRANDSRELAEQTGWRPIGMADLSQAERTELAQSVRLDHYLWRKWALKQQDAAFEPMTGSSFLRKEFSRVGPQVWRRLVRSRSLGRFLNRNPIRTTGNAASTTPTVLPSQNERPHGPHSCAPSDGGRSNEDDSGTRTRRSAYLAEKASRQQNSRSIGSQRCGP